MVRRKGTKGQTKVDKILHKKTKDRATWNLLKQMVNSGAPEEFASWLTGSVQIGSALQNIIVLTCQSFTGLIQMFKCE